MWFSYMSNECKSGHINIDADAMLRQVFGNRFIWTVGSISLYETNPQSTSFLKYKEIIICAN